MLEKAVEQHLKKEVEKRGGKCLKWSSPAYRGVPDRVVFLYDQVWFIELKRPGAKPTKFQTWVMDWVEGYNQNVTWLDSKDSIDAFISNLDIRYKIIRNI